MPTPFRPLTLPSEPKKDLERIKQDIETSDMSKTDLRVPGVKTFKFKYETLRRL